MKEVGSSTEEGKTSSSSSSLPEGFKDLPPELLKDEAGMEEEEDDDDDDDEEEDVCRICRNQGDADNPLRYPCACSGSIKYVHQECLLQWLNHSNARQCEVCKHAFAFSPVYAENAPLRLPFQEFLVGMTMKGCSVLQFFLRLAFVLSVWLLIIPFITFWLWRIIFLRSVAEAHKLLYSRISAAQILTDCLHGFLLSASIVFIFLGATSLRDYFRHLREIGGPNNEREDDAVDRQGARAVRRAGQANRIQVGGANVDAGGGGQVLAGAGQLLMRNAARLEMQAARLEAHVEQMFDGLDDADGAEDVPFDELVGMQGPVFHLVENAITVLVSNGIFLVFIVFLPFSLGRVIVYYASWFFTRTSSMQFLIPLANSAHGIMNETFNNAVDTIKNVSVDSQTTALVGQFAELVSSSSNMTSIIDGPSIASDLASASSKAVPVAYHLSDVATIAVGYLFVISILCLYLGLMALIRYSRGEPLTIGSRFPGFASMAEAVPSLFRQFVAGMRYVITMAKVAFLLVIELGVFPLMCGWWLDICTLKMLGATVAQRVDFFSKSMVISSFCHWMVGIAYMLQISIFVSLLRGVLRNGVLYFLRDPADPNYNPFRDLIDDPVHKHARRVLLSVAVYGSLIVMLVFLPVKLAMWITPSIFPIDISISDPFTEIPADMLLFQICLPFAIEHFKPRATIRAVLRQWFTVVGWALGLKEFLLPPPEDTNVVQENGNAGQIRQERPLVQDRAIVVQAAAQEHMGSHAQAIGGTDGQADGEECNFVLRIVGLLLLAWMTLLVFNSFLIIVPVSIGRTLFSAIPRLPLTHGIKCNDIYAFNIGCHALGFSIAGIKYAINYLKTRRIGVLMNLILRWCSILLKSSALLSIWIFVIPVLIGLLFELLVVVPLRVPVDESPVFLLYQDWALGLIFLKIWTKLVLLNQLAPLVDDSWRVKFEQVKADGFSRLRGLWVLREIVAPIVVKLLTALCVPYVFARGVFPILGYPLIVNSAVYRFSWLGCLSFSLFCFCVRRFHVWFTNLHNSIRDDRYLIGRRLHNFGEQVTEYNGGDGHSGDIISATALGTPRQQQLEANGLRNRHQNLQQQHAE